MYRNIPLNAQYTAYDAANIAQKTLEHASRQTVFCRESTWFANSRVKMFETCPHAVPRWSFMLAFICSRRLPFKSSPNLCWKLTSDLYNRWEHNSFEDDSICSDVSFWKTDWVRGLAYLNTKNFIHHLESRFTQSCIIKKNQSYWNPCQTTGICYLIASHSHQHWFSQLQKRFVCFCTMRSLIISWVLYFFYTMK